MFSKIQSLAVQGLNVLPVDVEVDTGRGLPGMVIVGLAGKSTMESRDRVKTALNNSRMPYPRSKVTINLAPGDLKKEGPLYDLPIALGIMICTEFLKPLIKTEDHWFVGELTLDGRLRPVPGILSMAEFVKKKGGKLVIPAQNFSEASMVSGLEIVPVQNLDEVLVYFQKEVLSSSLCSKLESENVYKESSAKWSKDFSEVKGQNQAKRAMAVAAAGGHNLLMLGPPGSGKSMLAERFSTILPDLEAEEALEVTKVYSVAGELSHEKALFEERPFRAPHHTISDIALIGGGSDAKPGEISLAHCGVLFLDELPEFKRSTLEVLRQPLETGMVNISRAKQNNQYPANFVLIAAMNPCPCGYYGSRVRNCRCHGGQVEKYLSKISGPLLDRIDLHIEVTDQRPMLLKQKNKKELSTKDLCEMVRKAQEMQKERFKNEAILRNAEMKGRTLEKYCRLDTETEKFLMKGMEEQGFSTRAYYKILVVARTVADMNEDEKLCLDHVAEALNYRVLDQKVFG